VARWKPSRWLEESRDLWPQFRDRRGIPPTRSPSDLLPGWVSLLDRLCDRLEAAGWDKRFAQVEKFGTLRIHFEDDANEKWLKLANECEDASRDICSLCGNLGRLVKLNRNFQTLCDACESRCLSSMLMSRMRKSGG
jgi:hypothetical protein